MVCSIMVHHGEYLPSLLIRYSAESSWQHAMKGCGGPMEGLLLRLMDSDVGNRANLLA